MSKALEMYLEVRCSFRGVYTFNRSLKMSMCVEVSIGKNIHVEVCRLQYGRCQVYTGS